MSKFQRVQTRDVLDFLGVLPDLDLDDMDSQRECVLGFDYSDLIGSTEYDCGTGFAFKVHAPFRPVSLPWPWPQDNPWGCVDPRGTKHVRMHGVYDPSGRALDYTEQALFGMGIPTLAWDTRIRITGANLIPPPPPPPPPPQCLTAAGRAIATLDACALLCCADDMSHALAMACCADDMCLALTECALQSQDAQVTEHGPFAFQ